jgi:hypothetical protein
MSASCVKIENDSLRGTIVRKVNLSISEHIVIFFREIW